jgi:hypothetical protein
MENPFVFVAGADCNGAAAPGALAVGPDTGTAVSISPFSGLPHSRQ